MSFTRVWLLACLSAVLLFGTFYTAADIGPFEMFKGGGGVAPKRSHDRIRLDSQEVIIRLRPWGYTVKSLFNLFNEGEASMEWIGFPKWVWTRVDWYPSFSAFKGSFNGKDIEFNEEPDSASERRFLWIRSSQDSGGRPDRLANRQRQWMTSRVAFPARAKASIRITYDADYYLSTHGYHASYVYGTGSLWKGKIGKAVFIVDSTGVGGTQKISTDFRKGFVAPGLVDEEIESAPRPRPIGKNVLYFEMRDFEPDPGAHLSVMRKAWLGPPQPQAGVRPKATLNQPPVSGDRPPAQSSGSRDQSDKN